MDQGSVIGRYRIEALLGEGAAGQLYRARPIDGGAPVALKLSLPLKEDSARRLRAEMAALGRIQSPAVPALIDVGDFEERVYMVRALVDGKSLAELLAEGGPLPERDALSVAAAIAEGLGAAHQRGLIHRDLKPSNVIVPLSLHRGDRPRYDEAKLTDFGVFGHLVQDRQSDVATTRDGEIFGTPLYMSPEQALGRPQGATADVYGLGVLLFEMLYGTTPFEAEGFGDLLTKILGQPVSFPSGRPIGDNVLAFIRICLAKDPSERPANGTVARQMLLRLLAADASPSVAASSPVAPATFGTPSGSGIRTTITSPINLGSTMASFHPRAHRRAWTWILSGLGVAGFIALTLKVGAWGAAIGIPISAALGFGLHGLINNRRPPLQAQIGVLLGRSTSVTDLRQSIAIDLDQLIAACRAVDQQIMAKTIGILVNEYDRAKKSSDRQEALVRAVTLMEKLVEKLSPWYVRHQKVVTWGVTVVGSFAGIAKSVVDILARTGSTGAGH